MAIAAYASELFYKKKYARQRSAADGDVQLFNLGATDSRRSLGAAVDGANELQLAFPLVRGSGDGRCGVGCDGIYQEPGATDPGRDKSEVIGVGAGRGA
jgi:hypothetical protein